MRSPTYFILDQDLFGVAVAATKKVLYAG